MSLFIAAAGLWCNSLSPPIPPPQIHRIPVVTDTRLSVELPPPLSSFYYCLNIDRCEVSSLRKYRSLCYETNSPPLSTTSTTSWVFCVDRGRENKFQQIITKSLWNWGSFIIRWLLLSLSYIIICWVAVNRHCNQWFALLVVVLI